MWTLIFMAGAPALRRATRRGCVAAATLKQLQELHVPVMKVPKLPPGYSIFVIFQATKDRLGVRLMTADPQLDSRMKQSEALLRFDAQAL